MITEYTSPLIPVAVAAGKFPKADEDKLTGLAGHWQTIGNQIAGDGGGVRYEHQERHQRRPHPARQPHEGADHHRTGGGSGTSSAASTTIAPATGGSATGSHGDVAAPTDSNAWTGDLAGYQDIGNTAAVIGTVPAKTDASTDSSSGTTQDTTGTHGPKHTDSAPGTQPTSVDTSLTSAPTGTDSLGSAHDLDSTFTNATGQTPAGGTPGQGGPPPGGGPHHTDSSVSAGTKQDILDTVTGKNTGQNVANTLTPTSGPHGDHSGGASSGPPASGDQLTQTSGQSTSQAAYVRHAEAATAGPPSCGPSTWSGSTPSGSSSVSVPTAGATEIPAGTGASTPPPVMPISGANAFTGVSTPAGASLGPNIQIAPGGMSSPITTSGAFGGLSSQAATGPRRRAARRDAPGHGDRLPEGAAAG